MPSPDEAPERGEDGLLPQAIRVDPDDLSEKLDPRSRIDFGEVYTIEHNVKVRSLGTVNPSSMQALLYQFESVWQSTFGFSDSSRPHQTQGPSSLE